MTSLIKKIGGKQVLEADSYKTVPDVAVKRLIKQVGRFGLSLERQAYLNAVGPRQRYTICWEREMKHLDTNMGRAHNEDLLS